MYMYNKVLPLITKNFASDFYQHITFVNKKILINTTLMWITSAILKKLCKLESLC